jgi:hypothetical protein
VGPVDSGSTTGGTASAGSSRLDRLKTKLVEKTWDELTSRHTVTLASLDLGDDGKLGIKLAERIYRADDPFITENALRAATTRELAATSGRRVAWAETGGLMRAGVNLGSSVPVSGVLNMHVGFAANGLVEYRALHPYPVETSSLGDVVKNTTVDLPFSADKAKAMPKGAQVEIIGKGDATLSTGLHAGASTTSGNFTGGISGGISGSTTRSGNYGVKVTRLDDDKVRVILSEVQGRSRGVSAGVHAGITVDGAAVIDDSLGGTIDSASESVDIDGTLKNIPGAEDGLADLIKDAGASALESAVRKYTAFHASVGKTASEERKTMVAYVLDLSTPQGSAAYEDLIRLKESDVAQKAQAGTTGIKRHVYEETTVSAANNAAVRFAGKKLLLFRALKAESEGTLNTTSGTTLIRTGKYERDYSGFITGEKKIKWEAVSTTDGASGATGRFMNMKFEKDDKITHNREIRAFVRFADLIGVEDADERNIVMPGSNWLGRLFSDDDNTRVRVDIYFTDDGVEKITGSDSPAVRAAFAQAQEKLDPEVRDVPINNPQALDLARQYNALEKEIRRTHDSREEQDLRSDQRWIARDYGRAFPGRKLRKDAKVFEGAESLAGYVADAGVAGTESGWVNLFAELGKSKKFDYMPTLGALALLAGKEETLVHELSIDGDELHLRSVDEGKLIHPDSTVNSSIGGIT